MRTFARQLARESGYELDWQWFGRNPVGRDLLYIARDLSVNALAKPHVRGPEVMRNIIHAEDRLEGNRNLPDLLSDVIRPSRATAFERLSEADALNAHPELGEAFKTLHRAAGYFLAVMPDDAKAQENALASVRKRVQQRRNLHFSIATGDRAATRRGVETVDAGAGLHALASIPPATVARGALRISR